VLENSHALDLAVGRSTVRQAILALLMDKPGCRLHLREIQRRAATSPGTASRELAKLVAAGLVEREAEGAQVYFRVSDSPFATMLRSIIAAMPAPEAGPRPRRLPRPARTRAAAESAGPQAATPAAEAAKAAPEVAARTVADQSVEAEAEQASQVAADPAVEAAVQTEVDGGPAAPAESAQLPPRILQPAPRQRAQSHSGRAAGAATAVSRTATGSTDAMGVRVATRFAESIREMYGDTLRGVYLYGAWAAGTASADADVETIIVLDQVDHYGAELEMTSHLCASLAHEFGILLSRVFVSESAWEGGPDGVPPSVRAEAVAV
jgi:DNA-binding transcriptional ArsR family regulator